MRSEESRVCGEARGKEKEENGNGALIFLPAHLTILNLEPDTTVVKNNKVLCSRNKSAMSQRVLMPFVYPRDS